MLGAHRRYFERMTGRWAGKLVFAVYDASALAAAPLSALDRARIRMMAASARWLAAGTMRTTVAHERGSVLHTTRVVQKGITVFSSDERIVLFDDGRSFSLGGAYRLFGSFGTRSFIDASGVVDEDAEGAHYRLDLFGSPLDQRTRVDDGGLRVVQRTAFSTAEVMLRRVSH